MSVLSPATVGAGLAAGPGRVKLLSGSRRGGAGDARGEWRAVRSTLFQTRIDGADIAGLLPGTALPHR